MTDFAILLGGDIVDTPRLRSQLSGRTIIAADSGIRHANTLGLEVELWVGDFDSSSDQLKREFAHVKTDEWSPEKDLTDSEIAIQHAQQQSAKSILFVGAFGGRADHSTNHLLMCFDLGCEVILTSGTQEALPIFGKAKPNWPAGTVFSILAIDDLTGLSITGAKWPLEKVETKAGSSLTISNQVIGELTVSVETGRAIVLGSVATDDSSD